jgi:Tfp pilus assembly protein PilO
MPAKKKAVKKDSNIQAQLQEMDARISRLERGQLPSKEDLNKREHKGGENGEGEEKKE